MAREKVRDLGEVLRDEMVMKDRIASLLREKPRTIPEIADALSCPVRDVTFWVMAMRRYGSLEEMPKPKTEEYFRYKPAR
jgi:hypothetical protein